MFETKIGNESPKQTIELENPIKQAEDKVLVDTTVKEVAIIGDIHQNFFGA